MTPDDFEKRLANVPLRAVPAEWEAEILALGRKERKQTPRPFWPFFRALLWPHPAAWAALAAVWAAILVLNLSGPRGDYLMTAKKPVNPPDPAVWAAELRALKVRNEMLAFWAQESGVPPRNRL